jgi:Arc/MetJ-type ribon-helix-helix transcriptional regulator
MATPGPEPHRRTVTIPEEVAQGIDDRIRESGFASVDAFVEFVLARLLETPGEIPFSEEDERRLKERLRSLGYID